MTITIDAYVAKITQAYIDGRENAYEAYLQKYGDGLLITATDDIAFVKLCASLDFEELPLGTALYQDYASES